MPSRPNKRARKTLNKKYRLHGTDLWGTLGRSFKDNSIVNKIAYRTYKILMNKLKTRYGKTSGVKKILKKFPRKYIKSKSKKFTYAVDIESDQRMSSHGRRPYSAGGMARILRRRISLFYGGGRIRIPTFRIYSKIADQRNREDQLTLLRRKLVFTRSLASILETRADVFFFRIGFFNSIFEARNYCYFRRARVRTVSKCLMPWQRIESFEICFVTFFRRLQSSFKIRLAKGKVYIPFWVDISITFMRAFILFYPVIVGYPGRDMSGTSIKVFKWGV
jgi:hypothetical protein